MSGYIDKRQKISVCMATYNGQRHLNRQLKSILMQLTDGDEIIISDDHSTDSTRQVIEDFHDQRIKLIENVGEKGPVGNFQNAISQATGDYIFLSDQDDVWLPDKVTSVIYLLEKYDLVISDCVVVDDELNVLYPSFFKIRNSKQGFINNLLKNSYMGCCMAFRKSFVKHVLPIPKRVHMHDWWIGLNIELKGKVFFFETPLILYVRHGNNASPTGEGSYSFPQKMYNRFIIVNSLLSRYIYGVCNNSHI